MTTPYKPHMVAEIMVERLFPTGAPSPIGVDEQIRNICIAGDECSVDVSEGPAGQPFVNCQRKCGECLLANATVVVVDRKKPNTSRQVDTHQTDPSQQQVA